MSNLDLMATLPERTPFALLRLIDPSGRHYITDYGHVERGRPAQRGGLGCRRQLAEKRANRWLEIDGLSISDMATSRSFDFGDARSRDLPILES